MATIRWKIEARDRVGMVMEVLKVLSDRRIDVRSMEVLPGLIFIKFDLENIDEEKALMQAVITNPDVTSISDIEALPQEQRERQMKAILTSAGEGIIAVDGEGRITTCNPAAERILNLKSGEVMGRRIGEVLRRDIPILRTLSTGEGYDNEEIVLNTPRGRLHYLTTGRPIKDEKGKTLGVVASIKDMTEVRDLVYSITRPATITFDDIVHRSAALERAIELARAAARGDAFVLIYGESGTGKELFARSIHSGSARSRKPFVPINCAALPDTLLESELFGYDEGAFTGARRGGKQGLFEFARGGTVFLDEIGELSPHLQAKLLRVLQEGRIRRVGGHDEIDVDVRIVSATNRDLKRMVGERKFREDLYYRLNVIPLFIPPLRERKDDIGALVDYFLSQLDRRAGKGWAGKEKQLSPEARAILEGYDWPGNVRELENVIERAVVLAPGDVLRPEHLLLENAPAASVQAFTPGQAGQGRTAGSLKQQVARLERDILSQALREYGSSRLAGQALGVSHTTVLNKIRQYKLKFGK